MGLADSMSHAQHSTVLRCNRSRSSGHIRQRPHAIVRGSSKRLEGVGFRGAKRTNVHEKYDYPRSAVLARTLCRRVLVRHGEEPDGTHSIDRGRRAVGARAV